MVITEAMLFMDAQAADEFKGIVGRNRHKTTISVMRRCASLDGAWCCGHAITSGEKTDSEDRARP